MFFAFKKRLEKRDGYYNKTYNYKPEFKAGMHCGKIMITEVGFIKKEIAYHGDVINTAARIQALCNTYNKSLLVSESIINGLNISKSHYKLLSDDAVLRGKKRKLKIYSLQ